MKNDDKDIEYSLYDNSDLLPSKNDENYSGLLVQNNNIDLPTYNEQTKTFKYSNQSKKNNNFSIKKIIEKIIYIVGIIYLIFIIYDGIKSNNIYKIIFSCCTFYTVLSFIANCEYK